MIKNQQYYPIWILILENTLSQLPTLSYCQVLALKTGSSSVVLVKELGLMLELPRILLNMYQVYILPPV